MLKRHIKVGACDAGPLLKHQQVWEVHEWKHCTCTSSRKHKSLTGELVKFTSAAGSSSCAATIRQFTLDSNVYFFFFFQNHTNFVFATIESSWFKSFQAILYELEECEFSLRSLSRAVSIRASTSTTVSQGSAGASPSCQRVKAGQIATLSQGRSKKQKTKNTQKTT